MFRFALLLTAPLLLLVACGDNSSRAQSSPEPTVIVAPVPTERTCDEACQAVLKARREEYERKPRWEH